MHQGTWSKRDHWDLQSDCHIVVVSPEKVLEKNEPSNFDRLGVKQMMPGFCFVLFLMKCK